MNLPQPLYDPNDIPRQTQLLMQLIQQQGQVPSAAQTIAQGLTGIGQQAVQNYNQRATESEKQKRIQQLAMAASQGDPSAMLQMGMTPEQTLPANVTQAAGLPSGITGSQAKIIEAAPGIKHSQDFYNLPQAAYLTSPSKNPQDIQKTINELKTLYPDGRVPKDYVHTSATTQRAGLTLGTKEGQFDQIQWQKLNRAANPINAPRGSLLGTAGMVNARADRALQTLNSKQITPQMLKGVAADIAGILKGGTPDQIAEREQGYGSLYTDAMKTMQYISGLPQNAAPSKELIDKLKSVVNELKKVDNKIISDNLDVLENTYSDQLEKYPERWKKLRSSVLKTTTGVTEDKVSQDSPADASLDKSVNDKLSSLGL